MKIFSVFIFFLSFEIAHQASSDFKAELNKSLEDNPYILPIKPEEALVINLWATWCGPCVLEIPELNAVAKAYAGKGVRFVAFSNESVEAYKKFKKGRPDFKFEYEMSFGDKRTGELLKKLDKERGGQFIPMHILIDKKGNVVEVLSGSSWTNNQTIREFAEQQAGL